MNKQNDPQLTDKTPIGAPAGTGVIQRFFNAWRRWEERMDYSAFDYSLDRIGQLESRILALERAQNATVEMSAK